MENSTEPAAGQWSVPECPFRIEFSARVLDEIRLTVVDAFFSLPRGGAEIGGILLGKHEGDRLSIIGHEALDCEHAMGPSFTLSPRDQIRMVEITTRAKRNPGDRQPVGWYHSHTRSGIFLSEADQDIHRRFFPEAWQVALVLKPHTFEPTRAGFFFRDAHGAMRADASYREFVLDPLPVKPAAGGHSANSGALRRPLPDHAPAAPQPGQTAEATSPERGRVPITREIPAAPFATPDAAEPLNLGAEDAEAPQFTQLKQERSWRAVKAVAFFAIGLTLAGVGYQTRNLWAPRLLAKMRPMLPREPDPYLGLSVADEDGQLRIQWDRNSPAVKSALDATLEIADGANTPQAVRLDDDHLATGSFTYVRESARVDVTLTISASGGGQVREQSSFLGKLPSPKDDPDVRKERDALAQKADKLQKDLNSQAWKTRKLEKDMKEMRDQLQGAQKKRQANQDSPKN